MEDLQRLKKKIETIKNSSDDGHDYIAQGKILETHLAAKEAMRNESQEVDLEGIDSFVDMVAEEEILKDKDFLESIDEDVLEENELDNTPDEELTEEELVEKKRRKQERERILSELKKRKVERESIIDQIMKNARETEATKSQDKDTDQKSLKDKDGKEQDKDKKDKNEDKDKDKDKNKDKEKGKKEKDSQKDKDTAKNQCETALKGKGGALQSQLASQQAMEASRAAKASQQTSLQSQLASQLSSQLAAQQPAMQQGNIAAQMQQPMTATQQAQQAMVAQQQAQQTMQASQATQQTMQAQTMSMQVASQSQMATLGMNVATQMSPVAAEIGGKSVYMATQSKDPLASSVCTCGVCPKCLGVQSSIATQRGNAMDVMNISASYAQQAPAQQAYKATQSKDPLASSVCTCGVCPKCLGVQASIKSSVNRDISSLMGITANNNIAPPSASANNVSVQAAQQQQMSRAA